MTARFEPGDLVRHKPTGEDLVVQKVEEVRGGERLLPAGTPVEWMWSRDCYVLQKGAYAHWEAFKGESQ